MAHSFIDYKGNHIDARDTMIEVVVVIACEIINEDIGLKEEFEAMAKEWRWQRRWAFGAGCVDLKLDAFLADSPSRKRKLVEVLKKSKEQIAHHGEAIDKDEINRWMGWNDNTPDRFVGAQPTQPLLQLVDQILALLNKPD